MDIGFIGVGRMGFHMARRLVEAGHRLIVYDTRPEAVDALVRRGAEAAASPRAVADKVETVLASLPTPDIVLKVATGDDGVIHGKAVRCFVDLSTTGSRMAVRVHDALKACNIVQIDSPVSGGVGGAEKGTLAVMMSGPRAECDRLMPVMSVIGKPFFIGEKAGMGQTMKLANNMLSAAAMAATSEAMVMGVKAGLDPSVMIDVINSGSGRSTASESKFPKAVLPGTFDFGFAAGLMYKDLRLCMEEAEALGVPMWIGNAVKQMYQLTNAQLGPEADFTTVIKCIEQWAGVEVRARRGDNT